jgi:hypothetical protein
MCAFGVTSHRAPVANCAAAPIPDADTSDRIHSQTLQDGLVLLHRPVVGDVLAFCGGGGSRLLLG